MTLSERLKQLRKERHMTQADLANVLGVAKGTVAMWEMGREIPVLKHWNSCQLYLIEQCHIF